MREIKFRAWDKKDKVMVDFSHPYLAVVGERIRNYSLGYDSEGNYRQQENIIYMQYTGLKDKHGVEVYEGDLLGNTMEGFAIAWDEELHSFWPINQYIPEEKSDVHWYEIVEMADHGRLEVIGNIYENPELLEAEL